MTITSHYLIYRLILLSDPGPSHGWVLKTKTSLSSVRKNGRWYERRRCGTMPILCEYRRRGAYETTMINNTIEPTIYEISAA